MIIVITNRALPEIPSGESKDVPVSEIGDGLGARNSSEDVIHAGILSKDVTSVEFYARGHEDELFSNIPVEELNKPWVFFVHGFNQDPDTNLIKADSLADSHGVNVVNFAWPARPNGEDASVKKSLLSAFKKYYSGISVGTSLLKGLGDYASQYLKDLWKNYEPALKNARESNVDLLAAMNLVKSKLKSNTAPVLLVHSMGNYLLQNTMSNIQKLPMDFNNIMLHQPDVDCPKYEWVDKLKANLKSTSSNTAKLYITTNYEDVVLMGSHWMRDLKNIGTPLRLGQTQRYYYTSDINYLDFSDAPQVNNKHEMFHYTKNETSPHIHACFSRIFKSKPDLLPENNGESNEGFSKMPTEATVFKLKEILFASDVDRDDDEIQLHESLSSFVDPIKLFSDEMTEEELEEEGND